MQLGNGRKLRKKMDFRNGWAWLLKKWWDLWDWRKWFKEYWWLWFVDWKGWKWLFEYW